MALSVGATAGIAIACFVVGLSIAGTAVYFWARKNVRKEKWSDFLDYNTQWDTLNALKGLRVPDLNDCDIKMSGAIEFDLKPFFHKDEVELTHDEMKALGDPLLRSLNIPQKAELIEKMGSWKLKHRHHSLSRYLAKVFFPRIDPNGDLANTLLPVHVLGTWQKLKTFHEHKDKQLYLSNWRAMTMRLYLDKEEVVILYTADAGEVNDRKREKERGMLRDDPRMERVRDLTAELMIALKPFVKKEYYPTVFEKYLLDTVIEVAITGATVFAQKKDITWAWPDDGLSDRKATFPALVVQKPEGQEIIRKARYQCSGSEFILVPEELAEWKKILFRRKTTPAEPSTSV